MKFPKGSKVERLVSKNPVERVLLEPWLDADRAVVLASSGQNAVVIPVELDQGDTSGPIPLVGIKAIRGTGASMKCGVDYCVLPDGTAVPRATNHSRYPPVDQLCCVADEFVEINLNAKLLLELAQAMGTDVVKIRVARTDGGVDPAAPLVVTPHPSEPHVDGAMGALLPYRVRAI